MPSASMSLRIDRDLKSKLSALADNEDRPVNYLINAAIRRMVEEHEHVLAKVDAGLADVKAGRVTPHSAVMREARAIIRRAEKKAR